MLGYYPDRVYLNGEGRVITPNISLYYSPISLRYLDLNVIQKFYLDQRFIYEHKLYDDIEVILTVVIYIYYIYLYTQIVTYVSQDYQGNTLVGVYNDPRMSNWAAGVSCM